PQNPGWGVALLEGRGRGRPMVRYGVLTRSPRRRGRAASAELSILKPSPWRVIVFTHSSARPRVIRLLTSFRLRPFCTEQPAHVDVAHGSADRPTMAADIRAKPGFQTLIASNRFPRCKRELRGCASLLTLA